jgi:formylglycine-generating enzyme required for sulfatase activity
MPKANDRIGPYQLTLKLGAGGFGEVWLAQDFSGSTPREVAVKTPHDSEIDLDALLQEATLWARVTGHLNVLEFLAARVFNGQVVLVSEYAPDGSLKDWLGRHGGRAPSVEAAVEMTRGILAGLEHLHIRGIIHRDIKPENILLLGATPRLADFGISRVLKSTGKNTFIAGTPHYMAPEAFNRRRNQQADLWSVGVMLYQMLSGRLPFEGNDWAELYGAILNENPEPLPAAVPEWLRQVVSKTLTKEPERRYQSAQEMREALRQFEREIEAEIAERERLEAERRRLEEEARRREEERRRLEEEACRREEGRKRREEEDRLREIERRRQIEEDARLKALQEELRRKEEELAKLKRVLPHEAVTVPIIRPPDEAATEPIIRRPGAGGRRIDRKEERKRRDEEDQLQEAQSPPSRRLLIAGAALAAVIVVAYLIWQRQITPEQLTQTTPSLVTPEQQAQTSPSPASSIEPPPGQPTFSFETVTLDRDGRETLRKTGQARYFVVELGNGATLEMVEIPSGSFMMGSPTSEAERYFDESPRHNVNVPSFWMGKFEVTQKQWLAVMGRFPTNPRFRGDHLPVEILSWNEAQGFFAALNQKLGLQSKGRQYQYRLPSESEWEYAARAGTDTPFAFGETITPQIVNYSGDYPYASAPKGIARQKSVQVGSLGMANAFGLFDMHGNVYEWCEDIYHKNYSGAPTDGSAWLIGGNSSFRVLRGGAWFYQGMYSRSAARHNCPRSLRCHFVGFRVVVSARTS